QLPRSLPAMKISQSGPISQIAGCDIDMHEFEHAEPAKSEIPAGASGVLHLIPVNRTMVATGVCPGETSRQIKAPTGCGSLTMLQSERSSWRVDQGQSGSPLTRAALSASFNSILTSLRMVDPLESRRPRASTKRS